MSSLFYRNINTHTTFSHSGKKRIMTVSVASRLAEVDDLTARHVSAYHSRSARISLRNAQYHVAKGNISLQRSASFNADRVGISLALRANITAQRAISRCQRQHITATLRVARVGSRDGTASKSRRRRVWNPGEALHGIRNLLRYGITATPCMESRLSLVWHHPAWMYGITATPCIDSESSHRDVFSICIHSLNQPIILQHIRKSFPRRVRHFAQR